MCPCDPNDNNLNPPIFGPPPVIPGFGLPFAPPAIPFPDISLPAGIPEDLINLVRSLLANIPGGPLLPNLNEFSKTVMDAIASLLNQLAPYLALYRFFQALLNIIGCLIDIMCSLMNPFRVAAAIKRLFKRCIPEFLNLFPWLALLAMIIALLLLLLALIEYIIATIIKLIEDIIRNLLALGRTVSLQGSEDDIISAAAKIAESLCLIEGIFAILIAFEAIMAIINALGAAAGRTFCGKGGNRHGDDGDCCPDEVCPPFIANNPDGMTGTLGVLVYHRQVDNDLNALGLPPTLVLPAIREETWQFFDAETGRTYNFGDIITEINGNIFWPEGKTFQANSNLKKVSYILDMTLKNVNPATFMHPDPIGTTRDFVIKDVRVTLKPYFRLQQYDGSYSTIDGLNGVLRIEGGTVYEADGETLFLIDGEDATLNNFIHFQERLGLPTSEDGYYFYDTEYTLRYNYESLMGDAIITAGCLPDVGVETAVANLSITNFDTALSQIPSLPDIGGAVACLTTAIDKFRQNVSIDNAAVFQAEVTACLNNLNDQTLATYDAAVTAGTSPYTSTIVLDPDVQFVSRSIKVTVTLNDPGGTTISFKVPASLQSSLAAKVSASLTFGEIGAFTYDGYNSFVAEITADHAGDGELTVSFNNNILSLIENRDNDNVATAIVENVKTYSFVGTPVRTGVVGEPEPAPRRDPSDVSGDRGGGD
jgi:hypothetical protein